MNGITLRRRPLPAALVAALVLFIVLVVAAAAGAQGRRCHPGYYVVDAWQISDGSGAAGAPATDGGLVAWADDRDGDLDIYVCDLETGEEEVVCAAPGDQTDPVVADGQVYWVDRSGPAPELWTADPDTGMASAVGDPGADQPAAGCRYVVWSQQTPGGRDIHALDRETGTVFVVCAAAGDQVHPAASDAFIAWEDHRGGSGADVYAWDVCAREELPISVAAGDQTTPAVYGSVVLWADDRSGDSDIYGADAHDLWIDWAERSRAHGRGCETAKLEFVVAGGRGDQTGPALSGAVACWTDSRTGDGLGDIVARDLTWGGPFAVADGCGAQTDVTAGADGGFAAWLDASGDSPVVCGALIEWAEGDDGSEEPGPAPEWTTRDIVTLFLGLLAEFDLFDEVRFAVGDGEYGEWQSLEETEAVRLPSVDGRHVIRIQLADSTLTPGEPGSEAWPFELTVTTTLDRRGPLTSVRDARVRRGTIATLRFRVKDALSSKADVKLRVKNRAGKVVKVVDAGARPTNTLLQKRIKADLKRGRYTVQVLARDLAGNTQRRAAAGVLVVR
jgi:beta propeller repeat protein